jgi:hypothetical protein
MTAGGVEELVARLVSLGSEAGTALTSAFESLVWNGEAAEAFSRARGPLTGGLAGVAASTGLASGAIEELLGSLTEVRRHEESSFEAGERGRRRTADWRRSWSEWEASAAAAHSAGLPEPPAPPAYDPGQADRNEEERHRRRAEERLDDASRRVADALERAADELPASPSLFDSFVSAGGEFFGGVWDSIRGTGEFVWDTAPLRAVFDPEGYAATLAALAGGVGYAFRHPGEALEAAIDLDTWMTNPARAAGRLVPDLVVGWATGGGSAVGSAARRGGGMFDEVVDVARLADRVEGASHVAGAAARAADGPLIRADDASRPVINLTAPGDVMGNHAGRITPIEGYVDVAVHGSPTSFATSPGGPELTPGRLADLLSEHPRYSSDPIRLISCSSGATDCGAAAQLADALDVPVMAPDSTLWVYPDGSLVVGEGVWRGFGLDITEPGTWRMFLPGGGS